MNREQLFESFSQLDEALLERSEAVKARGAWQKRAAVAACFALIAALSVPPLAKRAGRNAFPDDVAPGVIEEPEANGGIPAPSPASSVTGLGHSAGSSDPFLGEGESPKHDVRPTVSFYDAGGEGSYAVPQNGTAGYSVSLRGAMAEYGDSADYRVVVDLFRDGQPVDPDSGMAAAEQRRLTELGYTVAMEYLYRDGVPEQSWFTLHATCAQLEGFAAGDEYGCMLFLYGERVPDGAEEPPGLLTAGSQAISEVAVCPPDRSETIDHGEALADKRFGSYIPAAGPEGFGESEFHRDENCLRASWRKGFDHLEWQASYLTEEARSRIVSVGETEKYDLALYPIPRAESVPAELREVVDDPVFRAEELTLETVYKRAYKAADSGDTDGWRMEFSVWYPQYDGDILVHISAKGVTPEWLYGQLRALP